MLSGRAFGASAVRNIAKRRRKRSKRQDRRSAATCPGWGRGIGWPPTAPHERCPDNANLDAELPESVHPYAGRPWRVGGRREEALKDAPWRPPTTPRRRPRLNVPKPRLVADVAASVRLRTPQRSGPSWVSGPFLP